MAPTPPDEASKQEHPTPSRRRGWWRAGLEVGAVVIGAWLGGVALATLWPMRNATVANLSRTEAPISLVPAPVQPVTVLVVGLDSDGIPDTFNRAGPEGPANADCLMLVRVEAGAPLRILQVPIELGVNLPGQPEMEALGASYRDGGVALTADVVAAVIGLPDDEPSRFVVMPRKALRTLVDGLGDVDINLTRNLNHRDRRQGYTVNLQAGRQILNGLQAEELVRYRPDAQREQERRLNQQTLIQAIYDQLQTPGTLMRVPDLISDLLETVDTDLSRTEWLSLAAAALDPRQPPEITSLSLAAREGEQPLRQLKADLTRPLWPSNRDRSPVSSE